MTMRADVDRVATELADLIRIPSVTGDERGAQEVVASIMGTMGLEVSIIETDPVALAMDPAFPGMEVDRSDLVTVVGTWDSGRPGPTRMLLGHIDVVPPGDDSTWTAPAFDPVVRDGRMFGRGACDMKGGVVANFEAVRLAMQSGLVSGKVVVVSVPAEEDGGAGTFAAVRAGVTADMAVITEPTDLDIVIAHAGAITFTLHVPGKAAHASTRLEGVSALDKLFVLAEALRADETARNEAETDPRMRALGLPYPTIIGQVEGGSWASTVMDGVTAHGRYGVRLGQDCDGAGEDLRAAITVAWEADDWLSQFPVGLELWGGRFDSTAIEPDHPLAVGISDAHQRVAGARPAMIGAPYGADMRLLINEGGIPTVMYGPGNVRQAHSADEYVRLSEVTTVAETLAVWLTAADA